MSKITFAFICSASLLVACGGMQDDFASQGLSGKGDNGQTAPSCHFDDQCDVGEYCRFEPGECLLPTLTFLEGSCTPMPEICTKELNYVCGCDGNTYGNPCEARRAGVSIATMGACQQVPPPTTCVSDNDCGVDQFCHVDDGACRLPTFDILQGECKDKPPGCTKELRPVCGCDDQTYGNRCEAYRAGVSIIHEGACTPPPPPQGCFTSADCGAGRFCLFGDGACRLPTFNILQGECKDQPQACTRELRPVCACDDQTYSNRCEAYAAGVSIIAEGPCTL